MQRRTLLATAAAVVGSSAAATAYSSAEVSRDATIEVSGDEEALIELVAGDSELISDEGDALAIDVNNANTDAQFTFGNGDDIEEDYAFTIGNGGSYEYEFDITYDANGDDVGDAVKFTIYTEEEGEYAENSAVTDDDEVNITLTTEEDNSVAYVVLDIDTTGIEDEDEDLSGTLDISASQA